MSISLLQQRSAPWSYLNLGHDGDYATFIMLDKEDCSFARARFPRSQKGRVAISMALLAPEIYDALTDFARISAQSETKISGYDLSSYYKCFRKKINKFDMYWQADFSPENALICSDLSSEKYPVVLNVQMIDESLNIFQPNSPTLQLIAYAPILFAAAENVRVAAKNMTKEELLSLSSDFDFSNLVTIEEILAFTDSVANHNAMMVQKCAPIYIQEEYGVGGNIPSLHYYTYDEIKNIARVAKQRQHEWQQLYPNYCRNCNASGRCGNEGCSKCIKVGCCPRCDDTTWKSLEDVTTPCRHCGWWLNDEVPPYPLFNFVKGSSEKNSDKYVLSFVFEDHYDDGIKWRLDASRPENISDWYRNHPDYPSSRPSYKCSNCDNESYSDPVSIYKCEACDEVSVAPVCEDHLYCPACDVGYPVLIVDEACEECEESIEA